MSELHEDFGTTQAQRVVTRAAPDDLHSGAGDAAPSPGLSDAAQRELDRMSSEVASVASAMLQALPEHVRALAPEGLSPLETLKWVTKASGSPLARSTTVPTTDTRPPAATPRQVDWKSLSPTARLSAGYR